MMDGSFLFVCDLAAFLLSAPAKSLPTLKRWQPVVTEGGAVELNQPPLR